MLYQILTFLLEVVVTLVGGACLLRAWARWQCAGLEHPLGRLIQALSDWLVLPLHRIIPNGRRLDVVSLVAAWLLKLLQWAALLTLGQLHRWSAWPLLAFLDTAKLAITVAMVIIIIAVVFSWTQNRSLLAVVIQRIAEPLLAPFRRLLPLVGGIDLSPLLALVALQIGSIVLQTLLARLLMASVPGLG